MGAMDLTSVRDSSDQLVKSVQCYNPKPLLLHGYIAPFVSAYAVLFYVWFVHLGADPDYTDYYFISIGASVFIQILVYLSSLWSVHCYAFLAFTKNDNVVNALCAKVVPTANNGSPEMVRLNRTKIRDEETIWFMFQKTKYLYDAETGHFAQIVFASERPIQEYQEARGYLSDEELTVAEKLYGKNNLEMEIPDFWSLFRERAIAPFFVFQVFCVGLWCLDEFWYYSLFTLFMLVSFESILVQQQLRNMAEIRKMGTKPYSINVYRNRKWRAILTSELVPGDIVSIGRSPNDDPVPCDLILLRGSCIVDESMLTGESVPQMKEPLETVTERRPFNIDTDGNLHMLYGGTKVLQHSTPPKSATAIKGTDSGCVCYVLRTSFNTSQGKLLRTILYGVQRVTANNLETFAFILFLLIFAIAAATYVWIRGSANPKRNRYKLMLECALILTSVVPPELPIELSLAVNSSLNSLIRLYIFCTEPFRIPFAGKVDICCFDKTGTLTSNNLVVEGVAGLNPDKSGEIVPASEAPAETIQVLASCNSLVQLEDGLVGDPLEKATLAAIDWTLTKGDAVVPKKGRIPGMKIFHRNHFSSHLKRMSVIAGYNAQAGGGAAGETTYIASVKGAPEVLKPMFTRLPANYEQVYLEMSRRGTRVLALGRKSLGSLSKPIREYAREDLEKGLDFAGFLIISCPLKPDSRVVMKELVGSSHYVTMITGDAPLTACHVAKELHFTAKKDTLILRATAANDVKNGDSSMSMQWISIDESLKLDLKGAKGGFKSVRAFFAAYDLCVTGDALNALLDHYTDYVPVLLPHVRVFARIAPKQKEFIITSLRALGFHTLMCGDGTNDVGALKHAHVGVALISHSHPPQGAASAAKDSTANATAASSAAAVVDNRRSINDVLREANLRESGRNLPRNAGNRRGGPPTLPSPNSAAAATANNPALNRHQQRINNAQERMQKMLAELEEQEKAAIVKLGDASIAAPFTSKLSSIQCILHIIRQGRCTLVTTLQMFKILALNALILAYCQSVLYLDGIKFSDGQATLQGLFLTFCFLFITRSKPLEVLSPRRPLPNIFNFYTILTVLLQFAVHFCTLLYLVQGAVALSPPREEFPDLESEFKPSLLNSTVYVISIALQVSTFAVNYKGHPFMCSLWENKPLMYSIVGSFGLIVVLVTGAMPEFSEQFSIVEFPEEFQLTVISVLFADLTTAVIIDRICEFIFGRSSLKSI
ncbi:hypothetical protein TYRP_021398 [Tyrophagus putrescentiae]|nr:hypothetical protein TYRP_021398 [Tyrophagus putrescentiae]